MKYKILKALTLVSVTVIIMSIVIAIRAPSKSELPLEPSGRCSMIEGHLLRCEDDYAICYRPANLAGISCVNK